MNMKIVDNRDEIYLIIETHLCIKNLFFFLLPNQQDIWSSDNKYD